MKSSQGKKAIKVLLKGKKPFRYLVKDFKQDPDCKLPIKYRMKTGARRWFKFDKNKMTIRVKRGTKPGKYKVKVIGLIKDEISGTDLKHVINLKFKVKKAKKKAKKDKKKKKEEKKEEKPKEEEQTAEVET